MVKDWVTSSRWCNLCLLRVKWHSNWDSGTTTSNSVVRARCARARNGRAMSGRLLLMNCRKLLQNIADGSLDQARELIRKGSRGARRGLSGKDSEACSCSSLLVNVLHTYGLRWCGCVCGSRWWNRRDLREPLIEHDFTQLRFSERWDDGHEQRCRHQHRQCRNNGHSTYGDRQRIQRFRGYVAIYAEPQRERLSHVCFRPGHGWNCQRFSGGYN